MELRIIWNQRNSKNAWMWVLRKSIWKEKYFFNVRHRSSKKIEKETNRIVVSCIIWTICVFLDWSFTYTHNTKTKPHHQRFFFSYISNWIEWTAIFRIGVWSSFMKLVYFFSLIIWCMYVTCVINTYTQLFYKCTLIILNLFYPVFGCMVSMKYMSVFVYVFFFKFWMSFGLFRLGNTFRYESDLSSLRVQLIEFVLPAYQANLFCLTSPSGCLCVVNPDLPISVCPRSDSQEVRHNNRKANKPEMNK